VKFLLCDEVNHGVSEGQFWSYRATIARKVEKNWMAE
jgi:hypothetical protein